MRTTASASSRKASSGGRPTCSASRRTSASHSRTGSPAAGMATNRAPWWTHTSALIPPVRRPASAVSWRSFLRATDHRVALVAEGWIGFGAGKRSRCGGRQKSLWSSPATCSTRIPATPSQPRSWLPASVGLVANNAGFGLMGEWAALDHEQVAMVDVDVRVSRSLAPVRRSACASSTAASSMSPRWPASCRARAWRCTMRPRPMCCRSARRCSASWRRAACASPRSARDRCRRNFQERAGSSRLQRAGARHLPAAKVALTAIVD